MQNLLRQVQTLTTQRPPLLCMQRYNLCEVIRWGTREAQGFGPLVNVLLRHTFMSDYGTLEITALMFVTDIIASYVIDAQQRGFVYRAPAASSVTSNAPVIARSLIDAITYEASLSVHPLSSSFTPCVSMTLLDDGRVSVTFPTTDPPRKCE